MQLVRRLIGSSIGRKWIMAITGLCLVGFLVAHLAGNLFIYGGSSAFNAYAEGLHSLEPFLHVVEAGLLLVALVHITFGIILIVENLSARKRYHTKKSEGGRTWGSRSMLVTGPYILLFTIFHLLHFTLVGGEEKISTLVAARFADPLWAGFYFVSMVLVGLHVSHGLWSALLTLGLETLRQGALRKAAFLATLALTIGFASLPVVVFSLDGLLR